MIKTLFITFNLFGIFFISLFNLGNVEIFHTAQESMSANESIEVTITINKSDFSGPGRLKLNFENAQGLIPFEQENAGSSFTYKEQEALFIWFALPTDNTITIKYRIKADVNAKGTKKITGSFSYLDKEERQKIDIEPLIIQVNNEEITSQTNINVPGNDISESNSNVNCYRTIEAKDNYYIVKIHANKGNDNGFARIKDYLPEGFSAESIETAGAVFKNIDNSAKFLWSDIPSSLESFTVSYKLIPSDVNESFSITGTFSAEFLLINGEHSVIDIEETKYEVVQNNIISNSDTLLTENNNIEETPEEDVEEETVIDNNEEIQEEDVEEEIEVDNIEETSEEDVEEGIVVDNNEETLDEAVEEEIVVDNNELKNNIKIKNDVENNINEENIFKKNNSSSSIEYKVQILAAHKIASKNYFHSRHNFKENFDIENHEGWVKFTIGSYSKYKGARDKRENISSHNFPGPFVTAYNNNERITVQEALMISKQNWLQ